MKRKIRLLASILSFLMLMSSFQFMSSAEISDTLSQQSETQGAAAETNSSSGGETPTTSAIDSTVTSGDAIIITEPSITEAAINALSDVTVTTDSSIASNVSEAATSLLVPQRALARTSVLNTTSQEPIDTENGIPAITDTEIGSRIFPANTPEDIWLAFTGDNLQKLINDNTIRFELVDTLSSTSVVAYHNSQDSDMMIGGDNNLLWMNMRCTDLNGGIPAGTYTIRLVPSSNTDIYSNSVRLQNESLIQVTAEPAVEISCKNNIIGSLQKNNGNVEYIYDAEMYNINTNDIQVSLVNSKGDEIQAAKYSASPSDKVGKIYGISAYFDKMPSDTNGLKLLVKYKDTDGSYKPIANNLTPIRTIENEIVYRSEPSVPADVPYNLSVNGWNLDTTTTYTAKVYENNDQDGTTKVAEMTAKPTNSTRLDFTCLEKLLGKYRLEVSRTDNGNILNTIDIKFIQDMPLITDTEISSRIYPAKAPQDIWVAFTGQNLSKLINDKSIKYELVDSSSPTNIVAYHNSWDSNVMIGGDNNLLWMNMKPADSENGVPVGTYTLKLSTGNTDIDLYSVRLQKDSMLQFTADPAVNIDSKSNLIGSLEKNNDNVEYVYELEMYNVNTEDVQVSLVDSSGNELVQASKSGVWPKENTVNTYGVFAGFTTMPSITTDLRLLVKYKDTDGSYKPIANSITPIRMIENEMVYRMAGEQPSVLLDAPYTLSVNGWNLDTNATYKAIVYRDYDQFGSRKVVEMTAVPSKSTRLNFTCPEKLLGKYRLEVSRVDNNTVLNNLDFETYQPNMSVEASSNLAEEAISGGKYGANFDVKVTLESFDFNPAVSAGNVKIKLDGKNTAESYESSNISVDSNANSAVTAHFDGVMGGDYKVVLVINGVELGGDHINVSSYQSRPYISKIDPAVISSSDKYLYVNLSGYQLNGLKNSQGYVEAYLVKLGQNGTTTTVCGIELNNDKTPNYWLSDDGKDMGMGFSSNTNFEPGQYRIVFNDVDWNSDISWRVPDIIVKDTVYVMTNTNCSKDLDLINTRYISQNQSDYSIYFNGINAKNLTDKAIGVELIDPQTNSLLAASSKVDLGIDQNNPDNWFLITANFTTPIDKLYDNLKVKIGYLGQDGRIATAFDGCENIKLGVTDKPFIYKTNQQSLPEITLKGYNLNKKNNYYAVLDINGDRAYVGLNPADDNTITFRMDKSDYLQMNPGNNYRITLFDNDDKEIGTYRIHMPEIRIRFDDVTTSGIFAETNKEDAQVRVKLHFTEPLTEQSLNQLWFEMWGENNDQHYKYDVNYKEGDTSLIIDPEDSTSHTAIAVINKVSAGNFKFDAGIRDLDQREIYFTVQTKDELPVVFNAWSWAVKADTDDVWLGFNGLNLGKLRISSETIGIDLVKVDGTNETVVATCLDDSWISDDGNQMNLHFRLTNDQTFSHGEYKIRPNNNWTSDSNQYRINNTIFADFTFLNGLHSNEVGVGKSGYTLTVDGVNLNLLDKTKNYEFRLYKNNGTGIDTVPYDVAIAQSNAITYDDNGYGTISAVFSKQMPDYQQYFLLEIGYDDGSNFVKLPYEQKHPYYVKSVDYPTVTGMILENYTPATSYTAHFIGWNLRGTADVTVTKDGKPVKNWSNISVGEYGFNLEMGFDDVLTTGGYKANVKLNIDGNTVGDWNYDFEIKNPDVRITGFEGAPQSGDWVFNENTTVGAIGQNLQFRLLTKNMEGNINLDCSQVMLEGKDGTNLNYFASLQTTEGGIVVAKFNGVQPGRYRLKARINAYNQDYGIDEASVAVNSFQGKAAVTGSSSWSIAASAGKKDFNIRYFGVNFDTLRKSINNNSVAGKLVNIDTGAEISADSNSSWINDENNGLEFNFHVASLPAGEYKLVVNNSNWDDSCYRIPNLLVSDNTFATEWVYPEALGAGINNYRIQAEIENLDAMDSSAGKLEFRLLNTQGNPNFFASADAILPTDGSNKAYADFTQALPARDQYMKLQIGNVINGTFTAIPGGEKIIRVVDWTYLYDAAAIRADDSYQVYNLNIKGWNIPTQASIEIYHWDGEDRIIDIKAKQISIPTATSISTQLDFEKKITGDNWYNCNITYARDDGQTDSRDIGFKVEGIKAGLAFEGAPASGDWVFAETAVSGTTGAGIKINVLTENINSIDLGSSKVWLEGRDDFRGYYEAKLKVSGSSIIADFDGVQPGRYELKAQIKGDGKDYWINQYPIAVDSYQSKAAIVFANDWAIPESTDKMQFNINYDGYKLNSLSDGSGKVSAKLVNTVTGAEVFSDGCDFWNDGNSMSLHFTAPNGMAAGFYRLEITSQNWDSSNSYRVGNNFEVKSDTFVPGWKYPDKLGVNISNYTITAGIDNLDKWDNTEKKLVFRLMFNDANGNPTVVEQHDAVLEGDNRASASFNHTLPAQNQDVFLQIGWYTDNDSSKDFNSLPGGWLNIPVVDYPHVYDLKPNTLQSVQKYTINISGWNLAGHNVKLTVTGNGINKIVTTRAAFNNIALDVDFGTLLTPGAYNFKLDCEQDGSYKQLCDRNYNIESGNQRVVTAVEVNGDSQIVLSGQTFSYNAVAKDQFNDIMENEEINWQLIGNPSGISISASGLLSFADTVTNGTVTIRATSRTNSNIYGEKTVSFSRNASQIMIGSVTGFHGKTVEVPVSIYGIEGVDSATINITYDSTKLRYSGVVKGINEDITGADVNVLTDGAIRLTITTKASLKSNDKLCLLRFEIIGDNPSNILTENFVNSSISFGTVRLDHLNELQNGEQITGYSKVDGKVSIRMLGDVDNDGIITANDATKVVRAIYRKITLTDSDITAADADGDGMITGGDITLILRRVLGVDSKLPVE